MVCSYRMSGATRAGATAPGGLSQMGRRQDRGATIRHAATRACGRMNLHAARADEREAAVATGMNRT